MRFFIVMILALSLCHAHLESGFDKQEGPYRLDVGWAPSAPSAGSQTFFAVNIVDHETNTSSNVSEVWIRFSKGDRVAYAGTMALKGGSTSFTYDFPEAGVWQMTVQFQNYSENIDVFVPSEKPSN